MLIRKLEDLLGKQIVGISRISDEHIELVLVNPAAYPCEERAVINFIAEYQISASITHHVQVTRTETKTTEL